MGRLTDDEKKFGPITYGRSSWNPLRLVWSSGGDGDDHGEARNSLTVYAFGWITRIWLPNVLLPFKVRHAAGWDAATVARLGRDHYFEVFPREYGFCLSDGFLQLFLGAQTHDSITTQSWSKHLPWTQWRFVRFSLYDQDGQHYWTELQKDAKRGADRYTERREQEQSCPTVSFIFDDFDGKRITAKTQINEHEYKFGEGWFKWLSLFRKSKVRRSLDIAFSEEVGPEKGSWKGGTMGHGIEMLDGELHEAAFKRYCEQDQRAKGRRYKIHYIGKAE